MRRCSESRIRSVTGWAVSHTLVTVPSSRVGPATPPSASSRGITHGHPDTSSLLWLLANGSKAFGLVELLSPCPTARSTTRPKRCCSRRSAAWARGWQPIELHRQGHRGCNGKPAGKLIALAIAVDHASRRGDEIDPQSRAQIEGLQLPTVTGSDGWLTGFIGNERLDRTEAMRTVIDALRNLVTLRPLRPLAEADEVSADPVLAKIGAARQGRVDHVRGRGLGLHLKGTGAHDQARDRLGGRARPGARSIGGPGVSGCRSTRPTAVPSRAARGRGHARGVARSSSAPSGSPR